MSFSSTVKNELCRIECSTQCCLLSEFVAVIQMTGVVKINDNISIRIVTENAAFARKVFSNIKKLYNIYPEVIIRRSKKLKKHISYILTITAPTVLKKTLSSLNINCSDYSEAKKTDYKLFIKSILKRNCCKKAYLRGAFLASGSLSNPVKTYHLEIAAHNKDLALELSTLISSFNLNPKVIKRKGSYITYLKEGENIVDFLNIIGAHMALLELENVRILKEMRNNVNRIVNCETANLEKTVNASVRQIENIKFIRDTMGFSKLPKNLAEIADLRLEYSEASLKELGQMLSPPLGKSGVNHRLHKLDIIAEDARNLKGEL